MKKKDALTEYCGGSYDWFYTINNTKREIKKTETYGTSCLLISDEQIAALKEGKLLVHDDGEYTTIVKYNEGSNE